LVKNSVKPLGFHETGSAHQIQQVAGADRIVLGPHDMGNKLPGGPVIDICFSNLEPMCPIAGGS
jgi:hypothetical protein